MSSSGWEIYKLGDVCKKIGSGATPRGGKETYLLDGPYALIRSQNVLDFFFSYDGLAFIDEVQANQLSNVELQEKDVLLNITGDSVARVCQIPSKLLPARVNQHVSIIRPFLSKLIPEYLKYFLLNPKFKEFMLGLASVGATRNALTKSMIENFQIDLPPLSTQHRIADILSSLDDKVELNRQTNATLEAIAQAIFKEWFINFNFPGGTGEMVESELGMIPKGWRVGTVRDILVLANETMSPGVNPDKLFNHYSIPAFDNGHVPSQELGSTILSNKYKVKSNSILVSKLNPRIPRIWTVKEVDQETSVCSTEFQVLLPQKTHYYSFVANLFSQPSVIDTMKSRASGTSGSHQRINPQDILDINIVVPTDDLLALYDKIVGNYFHRIIIGLEESIKLAKIRDSLLPKLMSGVIEL